MTAPDRPEALRTTLSLARLAQAGDLPAREEFFRRYETRVRQIVSLRLGRMLREFVELEDVVQEALLGCVSDLDGVELRSEGELRNWLAKVALNVVRSQARRLTADKRDVRRHAPARTPDPEDSVLVRSLFPGREATPSQVLGARELEEAVERALLALPHRQREVITLRRLCEMSFEEIGAELGISTSAARSYLARGLAKLSVALDVERADGE